MVLSRTGEALSAASVCIVPVTQLCCASEQCVATDGDGRFAFTVDIPAAAGLLASATGFASQQVSLAAGGADPRAGLRIILSESADQVSGRILDATGGVVSGALVSAWTPSQQLVAVAMADTAGNYVLSAARGALEVHAEAPAYSRGVRTLSAPQPGVDLTLAPASALRGRVVQTETETGIAGAVVTAYAHGVNPAQPRSVRSGPDGAFELTALTLGTYELIAVAPEWRGVGRIVRVGLGDAIDAITLEVSPAVTLAATLDVDGSPCNSGTVAAEGPQVASASLAEGSASISGLTPGRYLVSYSCTAWGERPATAGNSPQADDSGTTGAEEFIELSTSHLSRAWHLTSRGAGTRLHSVGTGALRVTIEGTRNAKTPQGVFVVPESNAGPLRGRSQDGAIVFEELPIGRYRVFLEQAPSIHETVSLERAAQVVEVTLDLPDPGVLSGRVVDDADRPLPDVWVRAYNADAPFGDFYAAGEPVLTDTTGSFQLPGFLKNQYRIVADGALGQTETTGILAGGSPLVVRLTDGRSSPPAP